MSASEASLRPWRFLAHPAAFSAVAPVLTVLGAATTIAAPALLEPGAFGHFVAASMAFQVVSATDLGLSQLADRRIAVLGADDADAILAARVAVAIIVMLVALPAAWSTGDAPIMLAVAGGASFMLANGPVTILRASGRTGAFAASALTLQVGMTAPRFAGLWVGGTGGCFAVLLAWYGAMAVMLGALRAPRAAKALALVAAALPLFAFNALWILYLMAGRAAAGLVSDSTELGQYAFGANLVALSAAVVGNVAQARYPHHIMALSGPHGRRAAQRAIEIDLAWLSCGAAAAVIAAAACARPMLDTLLPAYAPAADAAKVLAIGSVPLAAVAWTLPLAIARSARPLKDAVATFGLPLLFVVPATMFGHRSAGLVGEAWAATVSALLLLVATADLLRRAGAMSAKGGLRMVTIHSALALTLAATAGLMTTRSTSAQARGPLLFEDRFETLRLWTGRSGIWEARYPWGDHTNSTNAERQYYVDPTPGRGDAGLAALSPFRTGRDGLSITARPVPATLTALTDGLDYASGLLSTAPSFSFTYGTAEVEAMIPRGKGLWPAFWLLSTDLQWPPEIDVLEVHGSRPNGYWGSIHTGAGRSREITHRIATPDLSEGFHTYAMTWTSDVVIWTLDGREVARSATPADLHGPMYLLLNLAVGGEPPGDPDETTPFPATFAVRRVAVYGLAESKPRAMHLDWSTAPDAPPSPDR